VKSQVSAAAEYIQYHGTSLLLMQRLLAKRNQRLGACVDLPGEIIRDADPLAEAPPTPPAPHMRMRLESRLSTGICIAVKLLAISVQGIGADPSLAMKGGTQTISDQASDISSPVQLADEAQPPTLSFPNANSSVNSPIYITYTLPEAALAGSVKVEFITPTATDVLQIGTVGESAGFHQFAFNPHDAIASPAGYVTAAHLWLMAVRLSQFRIRLPRGAHRRQREWKT
jgi:hypothetical protein